MTDQLFGERPPAAVIFVSAVAVLSVSVEVVSAELFRNLRASGLVEFNDALEVIAFGGLVNPGDEIEESHGTSAVTIRINHEWTRINTNQNKRFESRCHFGSTSPNSEHSDVVQTLIPACRIGEVDPKWQRLSKRLF